MIGNEYVHEFWLEPAHPEQLRICPEHVYTALPCVGVFRSEDAFITYLRRHQGNCLYYGIRGQKPLPQPLRIYQMNYEVVVDKRLALRAMTAVDMQKGSAAFVTSPGIYEGHLILKLSGGELVDITLGQLWHGDGASLNVRLMAPTESVQIQGR